jgi:hypothetical protein
MVDMEQWWNGGMVEWWNDVSQLKTEQLGETLNFSATSSTTNLA